MIRYTQLNIGLCLILVLTCALVPIPARAHDGPEPKPIRFDATERFGPIGKVAWNSLGGSPVEINGRMAREEQLIWNGDLIEAAGNASAQVLLDSLGQIALRSRAQVRLATAISKLEDNVTHPVLIATLISGNLVVTLQRDAIAYVEAGGAVFSTTPGARFRIGVRQGRPLIELSSGDVITEQQRRTRIKPRDVTLRPNGDIVPVATVPLNTKTNKKTKDRLQWMKSIEAAGGSTFAFVAFSGSPNGNQTAPAEEPVGRGRLVTFVVDPPLGSIQPARTDDRGLVAYVFNAGRNPGKGRITATIAGGPEDPVDTVYEPYQRDFTIEKGGPWRLRTKILIAIAAVGVGCAIGCHSHSGPIKQQPPPSIP